MGGPMYRDRGLLAARLAHMDSSYVAIICCGSVQQQRLELASAGPPVKQSSSPTRPADTSEGADACPSSSADTERGQARPLPVADRLKRLLIEEGVPACDIYSSPHSRSLLEDLLFARRLLCDLGTPSPHTSPPPFTITLHPWEDPFSFLACVSFLTWVGTLCPCLVSPSDCFAFHGRHCVSQKYRALFSCCCGAGISYFFHVTIVCSDFQMTRLQDMVPHVFGDSFPTQVFYAHTNWVRAHALHEAGNMSRRAIAAEEDSLRKAHTSALTLHAQSHPETITSVQELRLWRYTNAASLSVADYVVGPMHRSLLHVWAAAGRQDLVAEVLKPLSWKQALPKGVPSLLETARRLGFSSTTDLPRALREHRLREPACDVNCRDIRGVTPLLLAAQHNHVDVVSLLLERGANPFLQGLVCTSWGLQLMDLPQVGWLVSCSAAHPSNPK